MKKNILISNLEWVFTTRESLALANRNLEDAKDLVDAKLEKSIEAQRFLNKAMGNRTEVVIQYGSKIYKVTDNNKEVDIEEIQIHAKG